MDNAFLAVMLLIAVVFAVAMMFFHFSRARSILEHWAEENGYEIVSSARRWFGGTFWWRKSKGQEVYYVTIRTPKGQTRRGWVRCGGWFLGMFSDQADVEWDE
jgi:hypothetical protein